MQRIGIVGQGRARAICHSVRTASPFCLNPAAPPLRRTCDAPGRPFSAARATRTAVRSRCGTHIMTTAPLLATFPRLAAGRPPRPSSTRATPPSAPSVLTWTTPPRGKRLHLMLLRSADQQPGALRILGRHAWRSAVGFAQGPRHVERQGRQGLRQREKRESKGQAPKTRAPAAFGNLSAMAEERA